MTRGKKVLKAGTSRATPCNWINHLPNEILLKILRQLGKLPSEGPPVDTLMPCFPFRTDEAPFEPHPGLRSYPFLGQVCRHWKLLLDNPHSQSAVWDEVVVDFGHEIITAVHTPIAWSDKRPSNEEFKESFSKTRLDASKILNFIRDRKHYLKQVVLMNSDGYYSEEGDFVCLHSKHDFSLVSFGLMCGLLYDSLQELTIMRCSDFFRATESAFSGIACLKSLKSLHLEDLQGRIEQEAVARLGKLTQMTELALTLQLHSTNNWLNGLEKIPTAWSSLVSLQHLTLRGHSQLTGLPHFLTTLPITYLDLSYSRMMTFDLLPKLTSLQTLCLQGLGLTEIVPPVNNLELEIPRMIPNLEKVPQLTALNLSDNRLYSVPPCLSKMTDLRFLDLSGNSDLKVERPLVHMQHLLKLAMVDLRSIHVESSIAYWSDEKCRTMGHISNWQKHIRRHGGNQLKVFLDTDG